MRRGTTAFLSQSYGCHTRVVDEATRSLNRHPRGTRAEDMPVPACARLDCAHARRFFAQPATSREAVPRSVVSSSRWGSIMKRDVDAYTRATTLLTATFLVPITDARDSLTSAIITSSVLRSNHRHPMGRLTLMVTARACPPNTDSQGRVLLLSRVADLKHFTTEWSAHPHGCSINPAMFSLS